MNEVKLVVGNNKIHQIQTDLTSNLLPVDHVIASWKNVLSFITQSESCPGLRPAQLGALFSIKSHWIASNEPATVVMPTGERVIIVMGAIYIMKPRVSGTFIQRFSCIA